MFLSRICNNSYKPHSRTLSYVAQEMVLHDQRTSSRLQALIVVGKKGPNQEENGYDLIFSVAKDR